MSFAPSCCPHVMTSLCYATSTPKHVVAPEKQVDGNVCCIVFYLRHIFNTVIMVYWLTWPLAQVVQIIGIWRIRKHSKKMTSQEAKTPTHVLAACLCGRVQRVELAPIKSFVVLNSWADFRHVYEQIYKLSIIPHCSAMDWFWVKTDFVAAL